MVRVKQNHNFPSWVSVFVDGKLIEEFTSKRKAVVLAKKIAKGLPQGYNTYIDVNGDAIRVEEQS